MTSRPLAASTPTALLPLAAVCALVAVTWADTFAWMVHRWSEAGGYYLHGFAVVPAAAWLAWQRRHAAQWGAGGGAWPGLALLGLGALLQIPAALLEVHFVSAAALCLVVAGVVAAFGGRAAFRTWLPALAFLWFMVPLPLAAVAKANLELKMLAAGVALELAQGLGVVAVRDGATIALEGGQVLVVGTVCSGLRFLVSLTALGAFVALASDLGAARKWVLFAVSVPVAFTANVARILALLLLADAQGAEAVGGWVHDVSGWLLFAFALAAILACESFLARHGRAETAS